MKTNSAGFDFLISLIAGLMFIVLTAGYSTKAFALPEPVAAEIAKDVPNLAKRGEAVMRVIGLKVYDIRLWTQNTMHSHAEPFALELVYDMNFKSKEIAERSISEMRKQGYSDDAKLKRWGEVMARIFPDVKKGDTLVGVSIPGKEIRFYSHEKLIAAEKDTEFARAFFDIWLSEKTSEPKLRKRLLGLD